MREARTSRHWLVEGLVVAAGYQAYRFVRSFIEGSAPDAFDHADQVIAAEKVLGLFHEQAIQDWFLDWEAVVRFWNVYYGLAHFAVPGIVLVYLWRRFPARYRVWRNVFAWMLALALIGFVTYPLTPPRLMPPPNDLVDTAVEVGGIGPVGGAEGEGGGGNRFAAMPSLHVGWSTWAAVAAFPVLRRRWSQAVVIAHPVLILIAIVATGNHWILDAPGGWGVLLLAVATERGRQVLVRRRRGHAATHSSRRVSLRRTRAGNAR